jgi:DNA-binding transcriptional LysR family regulator
VDIIKLRHLASVIRHRSFSAAAEVLGLSQSALSKSVRSLERDVGVALLERGRFGALPTQFGLALARHADAVEAELRIAQSEIASLRVARTGRVCIGCGPSEATRLLPLALGRLRRRAPGLQVTVLYGLNEALIPMVQHGEVDLALSSIPAFSNDPDLKRIMLHEDSGAVIARPGHPLHALKKPIAAQRLLEFQWVLARRQELERRALDDLFIQSSLPPPEAAIETTSAVLMKTIVMQSDLLTFLPREMIYWEDRSGQLRALDLVAPSWRRKVGITMRARAGSSPAVEAMIEELQRAAKDMR